MQEKAGSGADVLKTLSQLEAAVSHAHNGARGYLRQCFKVADHDDTSKGGGWSQFLNETDKPPTATGTSHGVLALLACGEPPDSELITLATRYLAECQCEDGGWAKPSLRHKCALTRITGLILRALLDSGVHQPVAALENGIRWLLEAQNADGGWGNAAKDEKSDVTSTSFALQAMTRAVGLNQEGRDSIKKGQAWLREARNKDHSWGYARGTAGTVAHTSEAVDGLLACGQSPGSLGPTAEWLAQHIADEIQFNERYVFSQGPCVGTSVIWTQVSKERGLIALLALDSSILAQPVVHAVNDILNRQVNGTYWRGSVFHDAEPIWAVKEAVVALRGFRNRIEQDRASVILSEELVDLRKELADVQVKVDRLLDREARRSVRHVLRVLWSTMRKPSVIIGTVTVLLGICYIVLRRYVQLSGYADILAAIAGFLGFALTLYQVFGDRRGGKTK